MALGRGTQQNCCPLSLQTWRCTACVGLADRSQNLWLRESAVISGSSAWHDRALHPLCTHEGTRVTTSKGQTPLLQTKCHCQGRSPLVCAACTQIAPWSALPGGSAQPSRGGAPPGQQVEMVQLNIQHSLPEADRSRGLCTAPSTLLTGEQLWRAQHRCRIESRTC